MLEMQEDWRIHLARQQDIYRKQPIISRVDVIVQVCIASMSLYLFGWIVRRI